MIIMTSITKIHFTKQKTLQNETCKVFISQKITMKITIQTKGNMLVAKNTKLKKQTMIHYT